MKFHPSVLGALLLLAMAPVTVESTWKYYGGRAVRYCWTDTEKLRVFVEHSAGDDADEYWWVWDSNPGPMKMRVGGKEWVESGPIDFINNERIKDLGDDGCIPEPLTWWDKTPYTDQAAKCPLVSTNKYKWKDWVYYEFENVACHENAKYELDAEHSNIIGDNFGCNLFFHGLWPATFWGQVHCEPSQSPSRAPSDWPSSDPSAMPSGTPSDVPSASPSASPSSGPSAMPSLVPSKRSKKKEWTCERLERGGNSADFKSCKTKAPKTTKDPTETKAPKATKSPKSSKAPTQVPESAIQQSEVVV